MFGVVAPSLPRRRGLCGLAVYDETRSATGARRDLHEIPLEAIRGTTEPNRVPPISVIRVGDDCAIRAGHHPLSVAKARGALTIRAIVA